MNGYYLHSRRIYELYIRKPQVLAVCEVILYSLRYKTCVQNGITVNSGQCLMTIQEIAEICGLTVSQVRTALKTITADGGISTENMGKKGILITLLSAFSCESEKHWQNRKKESYSYGKNTKQSQSLTPDPDASYDLKRAEERARQQVPKLKKRA